MTDHPILLSFGHGYSAQALSRRLSARGWRVVGTTRSLDKADDVRASGAEPLIWPGTDIAATLSDTSHLLISAGPDADGDPVLRAVGQQIAERAPTLTWAGYLSTTGVYGDREGGWVDETSECSPSTRRGQWRMAAEHAWQGIEGLPLHIFRLAGIYGPGRNAVEDALKGRARMIIKPGQVFNRIYVDN